MYVNLLNEGQLKLNGTVDWSMNIEEKPDRKNWRNLAIDFKFNLLQIADILSIHRHPFKQTTDCPTLIIPRWKVNRNLQISIILKRYAGNPIHPGLTENWLNTIRFYNFSKQYAFPLQHNQYSNKDTYSIKFFIFQLNTKNSNN